MPPSHRKYANRMWNVLIWEQHFCNRITHSYWTCIQMACRHNSIWMYAYIRLDLILHLSSQTSLQIPTTPHIQNRFIFNNNPSTFFFYIFRFLQLMLKVSLLHWWISNWKHWYWYKLRCLFLFFLNTWEVFINTKFSILRSIHNNSKFPAHVSQKCPRKCSAHIPI